MVTNTGIYMNFSYKIADVGDVCSILEATPRGPTKCNEKFYRDIKCVVSNKT